MEELLGYGGTDYTPMFYLNTDKNWPLAFLFLLSDYGLLGQFLELHKN